jgi:hypothetical protein
VKAIVRILENNKLTYRCGEFIRPQTESLTGMSQSRHFLLVVAVPAKYKSAVAIAAVF